MKCPMAGRAQGCQILKLQLRSFLKSRECLPVMCLDDINTVDLDHVSAACLAHPLRCRPDAVRCYLVPGKHGPFLTEHLVDERITVALRLLLPAHAHTVGSSIGTHAQGAS